MKGKFYKVQTTDYYGMWQDVPELQLKNREAIVVRWSDGTRTQEVLRMRQAFTSVQVDMNNHPDTAQIRELYVLRDVYGVKVQVPLKRCRIARPL